MTNSKLNSFEVYFVKLRFCKKQVVCRDLEWNIDAGHIDFFFLLRFLCCLQTSSNIVKYRLYFGL